MNYFKMTGGFGDIVCSTRVRLARNLKGKPYALQGRQKEEMIQAVWQALEQNPVMKEQMQLHYVRDLSEQEKEYLVEQHLLSKELPPDGAYILSEDHGLCLLLGEEDHIRLQVLGDGFCPEECLQVAQRVLRVMEEQLPFDYDEQFGYLTACPTNVGTGMRASVMIHLPLLAQTGQLQSLGDELSRAGFALRGWLGEGSRPEGDLYQVSNQVTLGVSEKQLVEALSRLCGAMIDREKRARAQAFESRDGVWPDAVCRSAALLQSARRMSCGESEKCLSHVLLGQERKWISGAEAKELFDLLADVQPVAVERRAGKRLSPDQRDVLRSELLRERAKKWTIHEQ